MEIMSETSMRQQTTQENASISSIHKYSDCIFCQMLSRIFLKCIESHCNENVSFLDQVISYSLSTICSPKSNFSKKKLSQDFICDIFFFRMPKKGKTKHKSGSKSKKKVLNNVNNINSKESETSFSVSYFANNTSIESVGNNKKIGSRIKKKRSLLIGDITSDLSKLNIQSRNPKSSEIHITTTRRYKSYSTGSDGKAGTSIGTLEDVARYIRKNQAKNIVVMCGAGISTPSGIPDFRTPGTGLYHNLKKYNIPTPTAVFDLDYFNTNPKPFFELAKELYPSGKYRPNLTHYFLRSLYEKGLLLRLYTQNIDGLERLAGIPPSKLVEAHGTFSTASCVKCGKKYDGKVIKKKIFQNILPRCVLTPLCWGIIKPDIVFFGEDLPKKFYYYLKDFPHCDLLIVLGTSLEVEPFAGLVDSVRFHVPRLLINREKVGPFKTRQRRNDAVATCDIVHGIKRFSTLLGWKSFVFEVMDKHEKLNEEEPPVESRADSGLSSASSEYFETKQSVSNKSLPPLNDNIKRYFHTVRSTPLIKSKSCLEVSRNKKESSSISSSISSISYYDFIRDQQRKRTKISRAHAGETVPTIHYTETFGRHGFAERSIGRTSSSTFSDSTKDSSDSYSDSISGSSEGLDR